VTGKYKYKPESDLRPDQSEMTFGKNVERFLPTYYPSGLPDSDPLGLEKKENAIQRFDCGFGFRVGAEFKNMYSLNVGYDWGFTDMYTDKFRTSWAKLYPGQLAKMKNHSLNITVGYRF
jgi:hypothetical protein